MHHLYFFPVQEDKQALDSFGELPYVLDEIVKVRFCFKMSSVLLIKLKDAVTISKLIIK